jgi:hypothetical protein
LSQLGDDSTRAQLKLTKINLSVHESVGQPIEKGNISSALDCFCDGTCVSQSHPVPRSHAMGESPIQAGNLKLQMLLIPFFGQYVTM